MYRRLYRTGLFTFKLRRYKQIKGDKSLYPDISDSNLEAIVFLCYGLKELTNIIFSKSIFQIQSKKRDIHRKTKIDNVMAKREKDKHKNIKT